MRGMSVSRKLLTLEPRSGGRRAAAARRARAASRSRSEIWSPVRVVARKGCMPRSSRTRAMSSNDLSRGLLYALCMLDVRRLRVLREVAVHGSFSAAAEALAFTQPAVSRQIATLEAEAGTQLVERGARGIRLTPAGELLVETAETVLDKLAAAEHQLEALAGPPRRPAARRRVPERERDADPARARAPSTAPTPTSACRWSRRARPSAPRCSAPASSTSRSSRTPRAISATSSSSSR